ncbi:MAG: tandem-95 repeat protein [Caenispirillum sp.]|nr:tandem-95 repeat protein [Caenispirillum sp.]
MKRPKPAPFVRPLVEEIEPRILYSADLAPGLPAVHALADGAEVRRLDDGTPLATDTTATSRPAAELIIVDTGIGNWQGLLEDVKSGMAGRRYDVVLIGPGEDGIARISDALASRHDLDAVHLISHGSPGALELGTSRLDFDGLLKHADAIRRWGEALDADADLLIYGCDVAATAEGRSFVDALARLTGADVAASMDKTGSTALGGDWTLEVSIGAIEARTVAGDRDAAWSGVLALLPEGGETRVNTNTAGIQFVPFDNRQVAMDANGNFVVVWQDHTGLDGSGIGIYAQRYDGNGTPLGANFRVNTTTADDQSEPQVAMAADGSFVVVWQSMGQDGGGWGVYAQRYDAAGVAQGSEFRVNTTTVLDQAAPAVAMDAAGNFVVVWHSRNQDAANSWGVYAQRYNAAGVTQGGEFQVNTTVAGDQTEPAIAMDAAGNFVVVWQSQGQDGSGLGIYAQRYDTSGTAQGSEFQVNVTTANDQQLASVAMDATGFVVTWDSTLQDGSGRGVYARRYGPTGAALTGEVQVATTTLDNQWTSSVAMTPGGGFIVSWTSDGQDGDQGGVYVRQFGPGGQALTGEVRVNTTTAGMQDNSSIATCPNGQAVVVWYGAGTGDADGVFLQRLRYPGITVAPLGHVTEGTTVNAFSVVLDSAPTADVVIPLSVSNPNELSLPVTSLTFTPANWNVPQVVQVTGVDDTLVDGTVWSNVLLGLTSSADAAYHGIDPTDVSIANYDNDTRNTIAVTTAADTADGNTSSFAALLANRGADGQISLREAIIAANNTANGPGGADRIVFAIPGTGLHTIRLGSLLPAITTAMEIDASTDDSFVVQGNRPAVILSGDSDGNGTADIQDGLRLWGAGASGSSVRGLVIQNFTLNGIDVSGANGVVIAGNWIGLDSLGTGAAGNANGVNLHNARDNIIGGSTAAERNVISGNQSGLIVGAGSTGNLIRGNYIGTDYSGSMAVANSTEGMWVNSPGNVIGGTMAGQGNVISGNQGWTGIGLGPSASGTLIAGNLIGLNAAGSAALANAGNGITVMSPNNTIGGIVAGARNVISGNLGRGLVLTGAGATGNVVIGNYIGTDVTGTQDINGTTQQSGVSGIVLDAGASSNRIGTDADGANDAAERNIISGNNWYGIEFIGAGTSGNVAQGNYIGTDVTGLVALGNSMGGVSFWNGATNNRVGGGATGAGNVIAANETGVLVAHGVSNNKVQGNLIGLGADGSTLLGNTGVGVYFYNGGSASLVTGNVIGTDSDGTNDAAERNVISGNWRGVALENAEVTANRIAGNLIGTDATGTLARGNISDGIFIVGGANGNSVGGAYGNTIAFNGRDGIRVEGATSTGNVFQSNSIHGNAGLGINLVGGSENAFGVTANDAGDADTGPNNLLNTVVLQRAVTTGSMLYLTGSYSGAANTYHRIEIYASPSADPSDSGEGRTYLGSVNMPVGPSGSVSGIHTLAVAVPAGSFITATVTRTDSSYTTLYETSEFSNAIVATAPNAAPAGLDGTIAATEDTTYTFSLSDFGFSDSDGHSFWRVWVDTLPASGTLRWNGIAFGAGNFVMASDIAAGLLTYTPAANVWGNAVANFRFRVQDDGGTLGGGNDTDTTPNTITIDIAPVNDPPMIVQPIPDQVATEDQPFSYTFPIGTFSDIDAGDTLTYSAAGGPPWLSFDGATRTFSGTPGNDDVGSVTVTVRATDSGGAWVEDQFVITVGGVNDAPVNTVPGAQNVAEDTPLVFSAANGNAISIGDVDALWLPVQVSLSVSNGTLSLGGVSGLTFIAGANGSASMTFTGTIASINAALDGLTYAPTANYNGAAVLQIATNDLGNSGSGGARSDIDTVAITVTPVNDAPVVVTSLGSLIYTENDPATAVDPNLTVTDIDNANLTGATVRISANYAGGEDVLGFTSMFGITGSWNAATGTLTLSGTATVAQYQTALRSVSYQNTSEAPATAVRTVEYTVTDGSLVSGAATRQVQVVSVNDAPVANDANATGLEDAASIAITLTGSDVDGTVTHFRLTSLPANGQLYADAALTTLVVAGTDYAATGQSLTLYFVPAADWNGVTTFQYAARDAQGALDPTPATATITVTPVNDAPVVAQSLADQSATQNAPFVFTIPAGSFTDVDAGDTLTYSAAGVPPWLSFDADTRTFSGTPGSGDIGSWTITVRATDGSGASAEDSFLLTVGNINDAPQGTDRTVTTQEDTPYVFTVTDFGFSDPADVPANGFLAVRIASLPGAGSLTLNGVAVSAGQTVSVTDIAAGRLVFTPAPDANGAGYASFGFQVQDDGGTANGGVDLDPTPNTITIDVTPVNDAPTVTPIDLGVILEDGSRTITRANLLAGAGDVDGDTLTAMNLTIATGSGTLTDHGDGTWTFTPTADWNGAVTFAFEVSDGTATVANTATLTVTPVNDAPIFVPVGDRSVNEGEELRFTVSASDIDSATLTYSLVGAPAGAGIDPDTGVFTWTPSEAQGPGSYTFDIVVSDGSLSDRQTITVTVHEVNDAPAITSNGGGASASITVAENTTAVTTVTASDADIPAQTLTYGIAGGADADKFVIDATTGELGFVTAPDHEHPADADGDNVYEVIVRVTDGSLSDEQFIAVTVANVNDNAVTPVVDADDAENHVRENAPSGTAVGVAAFARDADAGDTVTYSLDDDAGGRFRIDAVTGVVTVADGSRLDYEAATAHTITVRATSSDGSFSTLSIDIRLENLNDTPPVLTLQTLAIDQGAAASLAQAIAATDADGVLPRLSFEVGHVVGGHVESLDAPGVAITRFGQDDLLAGRIRFVHDGSANTPAFDVSVSDGVHDVGPVQAMIQFRLGAAVPTGPAPSVIPAETDVTPASPPAAVKQPTPTQAKPSPSVPVAMADRGPASAEQALPAQAGTSDDYRPLPTGEIMITVPETPQALEHDLPTYAVRLLDQLRLELANYSLMGSGGSAQGRFEVALPKLADSRDAEGTIDLAVTAARVAGITFSVGAVWWALRVGGLMASLFASAPAWRQFDPLPILRNKEDEDDHGRWIERDITLAKEADGDLPRRGIEVLLQ